MTDKITIHNTITLHYSDEDESFHAELDYETYKITVDLVCDPESESEKSRVKSALEKIYDNQAKARAEWMLEIEYHLLPLMSKSDVMRTVSESEFEHGYRLANITIQITLDKELKIDASFDELNPEEPDFPESLCVSGNYETGFKDFYVNGFHIGVYMGDELVQRPDYKLSTGDVAECELGDNVYRAEMDVQDDYVQCVFELDEDHVSAKRAFDLFEKVHAKMDLFVDMSRKFLRRRMQDEIVDIRKNMEQSHLSVEDIMDEMFLDGIRFMNNGVMEFGYVYMGEIFDANIFAKGSYNMGFTNYSFMIVDDEEDDDE